MSQASATCCKRSLSGSVAVEPIVDGPHGMVTAPSP